MMLALQHKWAFENFNWIPVQTLLPFQEPRVDDKVHLIRLACLVLMTHFFTVVASDSSLVPDCCSGKYSPPVDNMEKCNAQSKVNLINLKI